MNKTLLTGAFLCALVTAPCAEYNLKVDLGDSIRPVTHVASGSLYGVSEDLPYNIDELVAPLKPNYFKNPAEGANGNQHPFGDAFKVAERLKNTTGKVQLIFADILPGWPYSWKGWSYWEQKITEVVNKKLTCGLTNIDGYEIWNEPYGTWEDSKNGDFKTTLWKPTYELVRKLDPNGRIIGPCFSYYNTQRVEDFFAFAVNNNCVPDIMCWHQWGSGGIPDAVANYRALEKKYNLTPRPITINEYSSDKHELEGCPGVSVPFIAKFERHGIESAVISWWFVSLPGRLGSLLTSDNEKGGGWYMYKWYGDMDGYMANVTPPNDKSDGIDGFAAVNKKMKEASVVIGGNNTGTVHVNISNVPEFLGSQVNVYYNFDLWVNLRGATCSNLR
ncbi:MAG: hypothetical protein M0P12_11905 [Paludibacteraceae bacterium]|nr:hypothetical protein [Paludibacteraceae bacterium]